MIRAEGAHQPDYWVRFKSGKAGTWTLTFTTPGQVETITWTIGGLPRGRMTMRPAMEVVPGQKLVVEKERIAE